MHTGMHVGRALADTVIVECDIGIQKVIDRANVVRVLSPALAELVGAEV
jgi:hypothetical protein